MLRSLWAVVAAGLKERMAVRLVTFVSCFFVAHAPTVLLAIIAMFFALFFGYLMFLRDYGAFTEPFIFWRRLRGRVTWKAPPDFLKDLADKMNVKLNKKRCFGVTDAPIGAVAYIFSSRIIISRDVLALSKAERNAVVAHELAHLRPNQSIGLLILLYFVMLGATTLGNVYPIITAIGVTALFLILRTFISWNLEYDADRVGSRYSSSEALASALRHIVKPAEHDKPSNTHPSVNSRVARLLASQEPLWLRLSLSLLGRLTAESFCSEFLDSFIQDLKDYYQGLPKFLRPVIITAEIFKAIILLVRHRD